MLGHYNRQISQAVCCLMVMSAALIAGVALSSHFAPAPASAAGALQLQVRAGAATREQIQAYFNIVNRDTVAVPLSELKIRYWYTWDGNPQPLAFYCTGAPVECANVRAAFNRLDATGSGAVYYVEISFAEAAGSIAAGGQSGEIQTRFDKGDRPAGAQTHDYSFDAQQAARADWTNVSLYRNGTLVWGAEPAGTAVSAR